MPVNPAFYARTVAQGQEEQRWQDSAEEPGEYAVALGGVEGAAAQYAGGQPPLAGNGDKGKSYQK